MPKKKLFIEENNGRGDTELFNKGIDSGASIQTHSNVHGLMEDFPVEIRELVDPCHPTLTGEEMSHNR